MYKAFPCHDVTVWYALWLFSYCKKLTLVWIYYRHILVKDSFLFLTSKSRNVCTIHNLLNYACGGTTNNKYIWLSYTLQSENEVPYISWLLLSIYSCCPSFLHICVYIYSLFPSSQGKISAIKVCCYLAHADGKLVKQHLHFYYINHGFKVKQSSLSNYPCCLLLFSKVL